jgi:hypothetical protein
MFSGGSSACKRKQNQWKQRIPFVCCKWKMKMANSRLFAANGNGKQKCVFLGQQTLNNNR